jgi:hypothetical protein
VYPSERTEELNGWSGACNCPSTDVVFIARVGSQCASPSDVSRSVERDIPFRHSLLCKPFANRRPAPPKIPVIPGILEEPRDSIRVGVVARGLGKGGLMSEVNGLSVFVDSALETVRSGGSGRKWGPSDRGVAPVDDGSVRDPDPK